jgi:hypothetical protein
MHFKLLDFAPSAEANRAAARGRELPHCDALRSCVALTSIAQFALMTKFSDQFGLCLAVQFGFTLSGYLITCFLLRERQQGTQVEIFESNGLVALGRSILESIPVAQMIAVILAVLYVPRLLALESIPVPNLVEVPAMIVQTMRSYFSDFQKPGFDGQTLPLWPLIVLVAPRRSLSLVLLSVAGSSLVMQFVGLFSGEVHPMSMVVAPSAFDLLSAGSFVAVITNGGQAGDSENNISRWSILIGLVLAAILVGYQFQGKLLGGGSVTLLSTPIGFGVVNFVLEIVATTLVFSLFWRDFGGMMDEVKRVPSR